MEHMRSILIGVFVFLAVVVPIVMLARSFKMFQTAFSGYHEKDRKDAMKAAAAAAAAENAADPKPEPAETGDK